MPYQVLLKRSAEKEMNALPTQIRGRIAERLLSLENNPRPVGVIKLRGQEAYRLRIGDYRALFTIDDVAHAVTIHAVRHRREAYR